MPRTIPASAYCRLEEHVGQFRRTGWKVSEIAFGGWQLGGQWGEVDDEASIATLLHAFERGVNFVDTAEYYGEGHSEVVIGEALRRWDGGKVYVATKVRPVQWPPECLDLFT
jgi:aryl-alcohol dehydrogenase-like predicted oxidoreductase